MVDSLPILERRLASSVASPPSPLFGASGILPSTISTGFFSLADYVRGKILSGFPWNLWSYSWSWLNEALQVLNLVGLYAYNLLVITIFMLPAVLFFNIRLNKKILITSLTFLFIFLIYIYGTFSINKNRAVLNYINDNQKIYTKVISPNFELKYNVSLEEIEKRLENIESLND